MIKVGVLYPRSGIYPLLGNDLMDGLRASLKGRLPDKFEFAIAPVGFGENEKQAFHETEKLLLHEKCSLVIAFIDHKLARLLDPLFLATGKLFIVIHPGANHPQNWTAPRTTIFVTLLNSFLSYLSGKLAVKNGHASGALAASYYDGGYNHCASIVDGFLHAGGEMKYNFIGSHRIEDFNIKPLVKAISEQEINSCLSVFSGKDALAFMEAFAQSDSSAILYTTPMMFEEQYLATKAGQLSFYGYLPWHSTISTDENEKFKEAIVQNTSRSANIFTLLGWETGLLLAELGDVDPSNGAELVARLKEKKIRSPRGPAFIEEETHYLIADVFGASSIEGRVTAEVFPETQNAWSEFRERSVDSRASGWNNTYLCY